MYQIIETTASYAALTDPAVKTELEYDDDVVLEAGRVAGYVGEGFIVERVIVGDPDIDLRPGDLIVWDDVNPTSPSGRFVLRATSVPVRG